MARPTPTPSFGAGFDAAAFRTAIRNTMTMGLPNNMSEQATFKWTPRFSYDPEDPAHDPYTWTQEATPAFSHADVIVPIAFEFTARTSSTGQTDMGEFDIPRVVITILDVDYALVEGADIVSFDGNEYDINYVSPPTGLFEVSIYTIYAQARDES